MKNQTIILSYVALVQLASANVEPTVVIQSAAMRSGTTLMDVVYRVNDPDNATVKTRALAFADGVRSFLNVIRPVTYAEGTEANLGDAIATNTNHTLTWNVAVDWEVEVGQPKFEVLAIDERGLLSFDWITIPAAGANPEITISKNSADQNELIDAFYWLYASGNNQLTLNSGLLSGNANSGKYDGVRLVSGGVLQTNAAPFIFSYMNLDVANLNYTISARVNLSDLNGWHAVQRPYSGDSLVSAWGSNTHGQAIIPHGLHDATAIAGGGDHCMALKSDGTVVAWGSNEFGQCNVPAGLTGITAIAAGAYHCLALKGDGTVASWGLSQSGSTDLRVPQGLSDVTAIATKSYTCMALKSNGTVVVWGNDGQGQKAIPEGLDNVSAIACGSSHCLALKNDGTVVAWGSNNNGQSTIPAGLNNVTAIAAGGSHSLARKQDGTVIGWGRNTQGQATVPQGLSNVLAIAANNNHSLTLKQDGTIIGWGDNGNGQVTAPAWLSNSIAIATTWRNSIALQAPAP